MSDYPNEYNQNHLKKLNKFCVNLMNCVINKQHKTDLKA